MTFRIVIAFLMIAIEYFFGAIAVIAAIKEKDYKEYYRMMWLFAVVSIITFLIASL